MKCMFMALSILVVLISTLRRLTMVRQTWLLFGYNHNPMNHSLLHAL